MIKDLYVKTVSFLIRSLISLVGKTLKIKIYGLEGQKENAIFAVWHRDIFILPYANPFDKLAILAGDGVRGDIFSSVVKKNTDRIIRVPFNSDNPKVAAFAAAKLLNSLEEGFNCTVALDGPRGPIFKIKPGIFLISKRSGKKIVPVGVAASRKITIPFRWDKYFIPLPFGRVFLFFDFNYSNELNEEALAKGMEKAHRKAMEFIPTPTSKEKYG